MKQVRNITVDYIYRFFSCFDLADSIWVLFLAYRDMSLFKIGLLEGIFHLTGILFEVPTGAIADLFGRKRTLIMGRITGVISAVLMLVGGNFFIYTLAMITACASCNLNSGAEEALVYDSLIEVGQEECYLKINGRLFFLMQAGGAVGGLVGGFISEYSFELVYGLNAICRMIACVVAFFYKEIKVNKKSEESKRVTIKEHFRNSYKVLKENPRVAKLSIFFACISTAVYTILFYSQDYFSSMGMKNSEISTLGFVGGIIAATGALLSNKIQHLLKKKTIFILCFFIAITCIAMGLTKLSSAIPIFALLLTLSAIMECIMSNQLNEMIPSRQRATILSIQSMLYSIGMIVIFPLCGLIMTYVSMGVVFVGVGSVALAITVLKN